MRAGLPLHTTLDLCWHLLGPAAILVMSAWSALFAATLAWWWTTDPGGSVQVLATRVWILPGLYGLSVAPALLYGLVYRRQTPSVGRWRVAGLAHVFILYGYLWFAAGWRAIWQATTGKRAWAKTTRTADGNAAAEDARLAAMAREAVQTLDVRITAQPLETDHKPTSIDRAGDDRPVDWEIAVPDTWDSIEQRDGLVIYRDPERHMIQRRPARPGRGADPLVVFSSPERDGSVAVRRVSSPYPLVEGPLRAEATYRGCDYQRLRLGETTFKRRPAMAWQFIYREGGTLIHADELHLMARGNRYVVSLWSPEASWERMRDVLEPIRDSFDLFDG